MSRSLQRAQNMRQNTMTEHNVVAGKSTADAALTFGCPVRHFLLAAINHCVATVLIAVRYIGYLDLEFTRCSIHDRIGTCRASACAPVSAPWRLPPSCDNTHAHATHNTEISHAPQHSPHKPRSRADSTSSRSNQSSHVHNDPQHRQRSGDNAQDAAARCSKRQAQKGC